MNTEVRKRLGSCILLWAAFVGIKWIMLLGPSSILSFLSPLMLAVRDEARDYRISGWISLGVETAFIGALWLVRKKKITILYAVVMIYALIYVPTIVYWIIFLEFEMWRYLQFMPAVICGLMMLISCSDYMKQAKLKKPEKPDNKQSKIENEETEDLENGSSDE